MNMRSTWSVYGNSFDFATPVLLGEGTSADPGGRAV